MPSPAPGQMNVAAALQHLQRQVDQLARKPAGGGGYMGFAVVQFDFPAMTTNGVQTASNACAISGTDGAHGLSESGGTLTVCDDNVACVYFAVATLFPGLASPSPGTHVHEAQYTDLLNAATTSTFLGINTAIGVGGSFGAFRYTSSYSDTAYLRLMSTGGTAVAFGAPRAYAYITRFAA